MGTKIVVENGVEYTVTASNDGTRTWWVNGKRHRLDGPAYEGADGTRTWWVNGERHRLDGPKFQQAVRDYLLEQELKKLEIRE